MTTMEPAHVRNWSDMDRVAFRPVDHHTRAYAADRAVEAWYASEARCSCGCVEEHEIADRLTADGYHFRATSGGAVCDSLLYPGRGDRPRAAYRRAIFEVLRVVECLAYDEAVAAVREARKRHLREMASTEGAVWRNAYEAAALQVKS